LLRFRFLWRSLFLVKTAAYRKINDRSQNSSTYHKKDGTKIRAKLKESLRKEIHAGSN